MQIINQMIVGLGLIMALPGFAQSFRWEVNQPFATFQGDSVKQSAQVDAVLKTTDRTDAMILFIAANTAYVLKRIEDAGFLFHAASIRGAFDLQRYPPLAVGGNSPGVYLGFLRSNAGQEINPALTEDPKIYISVTQKVASWDCKVVAQYKPGWEYKTINASSPSCEKIKEERVGPMQAISKLFGNSHYVSAFMQVKKYNLLPYKEKQLADRKNTYDKALATMVNIEKEAGLKGFAAYSK